MIYKWAARVTWWDALGMIRNLAALLTVLVLTATQQTPFVTL